MSYTLERSMFLPLPIERVFEFFADAENLVRITPPKMGFEIRSELPIAMHEGTQIEYRVTIFGRRLRWRSLISRWDPPRSFVDEQLEGPYKVWIHHHQFETRDGGTQIEDVVRYALPCGLLGRVVHPLVRRELAHIFDFRQQAIRQILLAD